MDLNLLKQTQWHGGQLLAYSGLDGATDYFHGITARTSFQDGVIEIKYPAACRLVFPVPDQTQIGGDFFQLDTSEGEIQGAFLDAAHLLIEGPCQIEGVEEPIHFLQRGTHTLVGVDDRFDPSLLNANLTEALENRQHWLASQAAPQGLDPESQRALMKALSIMKTQVYTPEGQIKYRWTTPDRWPHRAMWLWDSVFHAIGWRHLDIQLARDMISAVLDSQEPDGFVAHSIDPVRKTTITQPPVLALGVQLLQEVQPDRDWLAQVYPQLCAYIEWDLTHRDSDGSGLVEWYIEADENSRSGESGMDNSPRFDSAVQLKAVDFNAFLALECEILAGFAGTLGRLEEARAWKERYVLLCQLINQRLWSSDKNFYLDFDLEANELSPVLASSGFLPLICGAPTQTQAAALTSHLRNPETFATPLRVASIAAADSAHYGKDMWRGPVWVNVNWLIAFGLDRCGFHDLAQAIRQETCAEIERQYARYGTFFEFFDDRDEVDPPDLNRKGRCAPEVSPYHQVFHDYGWTATLYVDMVYNQR